MAEQKQILVIDDDPDFLNYVKIVLLANNHIVRTASTTTEGLELMRQQAPDLVILDVMMSYVLDGWSVCREMYFDPTLREIPILLVSAIVSSDDDSLFPNAESCRIDRFLSKPVEPATLLRSVDELTSR